MLPNFLVIGAPRSGTTSLYEYLDAHPDVYMSTVKEPDFFARGSLDDAEPLGSERSDTLAQLAAEHPALQADLSEYEALFSGARGERRIGEASAVYLGHPTAAAHIRQHLPDAPLVAILRDPAERAYSHYVHGKRIYAEYGRSDAVGAEGRSVDDEWRRVVDLAARRELPENAVSDPEVWLRSGFYHRHLTRWLSLFPREQIRLFLYEDLVQDPNALMTEIYRFIDVDDSFTLPSTEAFNASVVPRNRSLFTFFTTRNSLMRYAKAAAPPRVRGLAVNVRNRLLGNAKPPLDPELRRTLVNLYRDDIEQLQGLLDRDLSSWLDEEHAPSRA